MHPQADAAVLNWFDRSKAAPPVITTITVTEIEFGLRRMTDGRKRTALMAQFEIFLQLLMVLPFNIAAAREAGRFWAACQAKGLTADPSDMMIAGIVAASGATLATRNTKDFEGLPILLVNPWNAG